MTVGPVNNSDEDEKDSRVEDIPAQKSHKDEEEDLSTDGSSRLNERHTDTDHMKKRIDEIERQKFFNEKNSDEYKKKISIGSCKKSKKIKSVLNRRKNKQDFVETSPQISLHQEEFYYFEMNVQIVPDQGLQNNIVTTFEDNIYNNIIQKPMNADISNKNFSRMDDWNIGLIDIKEISGNITQRSEPIKTRHPEKLFSLSDEDLPDYPFGGRKEPGFNKDLKKICLQEKSENLENKLSDSENKDPCSHSESDEETPGLMDEIQGIVIEQPDLLNEATRIPSITDSIHRNASDKSSLIHESSKAESDLTREVTEVSDPNHENTLDQSSLNHESIENDSNLTREASGELPLSNHKNALDQSGLIHESAEDKSDLAREATESSDSNRKNAFDQSNLILSTKDQLDLAEELPDSNPKIIDEKLEKQSDSAREDKCKKQEFEKKIYETPERYNNENNSCLKDLIVCDRKIDDSFVTNLAKNLLYYKEINELELRDCVFDEKSLLLLKRDIAGECKVTKLSIGYTNNAGELFSDICKVVKELEITKLSLEYDSLITKDIEWLRDCLAKEKVEKLSEIDISYNKDIQPDGFEVLGKTMRVHNITTLRAANCDITDTKFESLRVGLADATMVTELDLAGNKTMTAEGFKNLALFITEKDVKCLNLSGCQLTTESVKLFCDTLIKSISGNSSESSLVELDVSYNPVLEPEAYKSLGSMIWKCGVKKISLAGCGLDKYRLSKLTEPLKERPKVESLEVADNVSIGKGIIEIAKIVGECDLEILDISDCMLTADDLKDFREALGEFNKPSLIRLDLSDFDRTPDEEYITELCKIFPYVEDELRAQFRILEIFLQRLMQEKLNSSAKTNLKIILNDDDDDIIWQGNQDKDH